MIILDNLGQFRRGRLWVNDMPELRYKVVDKLTSSIEVKQKKYIRPTSLALEMLLSPRDMSNYAFLGVKFIPNNDNRVNITVNVGEDEDELLNDNIAMKSDRVFVGIPCEYAEAILNTSKNVIEETLQFPSGDLEFYIGAHGESGSSKFSFSKVTEVILKLLIGEPESKNVEQLETFISNSL
ncbi:hypothetical protein NDS46_28410 [Paenibacillus thiaminolyticus]|uniref:hypothetical protein n=1 Tax=Paenibacillus thiaminolyticus TaxID=49283 RepID=UPI00232FDF25|nr:hypothetical protein [Paenibacillus thiaminolyticus]WCF08136.1 hypothetical protein NDS46_28410 [Paenibacillus thiaminolyticus]